MGIFHCPTIVKTISRTIPLGGRLVNKIFVKNLPPTNYRKNRFFPTKKLRCNATSATALAVTLHFMTRPYPEKQWFSDYFNGSALELFGKPYK